MKAIKHFLLQPWFYIVILAMGASLKLYHIDYHLFWYDEVATIRHTSGNQILDIPVNEIKNISYYNDQIHLKKQNLSIASELKGLYASTNLNPLHYTFLMIWYRIAGDNEISYRLFNVFIFLLTLPLLFLLAKTLFKSNLAGWIAISLYAISPFFHYYIHEARYNTLLVFLIVFLHYLFLQAIEHKKLKWWIGYSVVGILTLYASVLSGLIIFGHFLYIIFFKKEIRITFSVNLIIILSAYLPWIISLINNRAEITTSLSWHNILDRNQNFITLLLYQCNGFTTIFMWHRDLVQFLFRILEFDFKGNYIQLVAPVIILILILSSIIYTIKKAPRKVAYFLVLIFLPYLLFFLISDIVRNTGMSLISRYQAINFIVILLFVVYLISKKITQGKLIYAGIYIGLVIVGFISIFLISKVRCFDGGNWSAQIKDAQLYSNARHPLLITDYSMAGPGVRAVGGFMVIMNECQSENIDILRASPDIRNVEKMLLDTEYSDIYVTHASMKLVENLKMQFGEKMDSLEVEGISPMWQIKY